MANSFLKLLNNVRRVAYLVAGTNISLTEDGTTGDITIATSSIEGVTNPGGDIDFVPVGGITIAGDDTANTVTFDTSALLPKALTSAHIFVGNGSNIATGVAPSGDATITNTGALTIANGAVTPAKMSAAARVRHVASIEVDLAGAAVNDSFLFRPSQACTITRASFAYTVATDANTGVTISLGKFGTAAYYGTTTSEVSKAQDSETVLTLAATDVAAGQSVVCSCAGGKTGTGKGRWTIEYQTD